MVRDNRIDSLKGILILLVIFGHLIGSCGTGNINNSVWNFIYTFHMPLFILVSGYFTKIKETKDFIHGLSTIAIPLIIFQAIFLIPLFIFKGGGLKDLLVPYWVLWYLMSLILWRVLLQYSSSIIKSKPYIYFFSFLCISILSGFIRHGMVLSIQRTLYFYPFFLCGYYMKNKIFKEVVWNKWISFAIIIAVFIGAFSGLYPANCKGLLKGTGGITLKVLYLKPIVLTISFLLSISIFNVAKGNNFLAKMGKDSLFYYLYHALVLKFGVFIVVSHFHLPSSFVYMIGYFICVVVLLIIMSKIKVLRWLVNPTIKFNK